MEILCLPGKWALAYPWDNMRAFDTLVVLVRHVTENIFEEVVEIVESLEKEQ